MFGLARVTTSTRSAPSPEMCLSVAESFPESGIRSCHQTQNKQNHGHQKYKLETKKTKQNICSNNYYFSRTIHLEQKH
jgi:hypothetical protein